MEDEYMTTIGESRKETKSSDDRGLGTSLRPGDKASEPTLEQINGLVLGRYERVPF